MAFPNRHNSRLTALVVDDSELKCIIYPRHLNILGVDAITVKNGKEAVEIFQSGAVFDLVLMDMYMPIMNGIQATRALREMGVTSFIIGATGESNGDKIQEFMEAGLNHCYGKPMIFYNLAAIVTGIRNS